uniref:Uncharacterized protein n=1 Tax=viral metagenome TaxID=1070528 RepID=A0A6H1ZRG9_9ZZZZ
MKADIPKDYPADDIAMLMSVAEKLGINIAHVAQPIPGVFKIVKGVVNCTLCKTITLQWMKVSKYSDGMWKKEKDLEEFELAALQEHVLKAQEISAKVRICWNCKDTLMLKEKEELVNIIVSLHNPIVTKQEIWKYINVLRGASVHEATRRRKREIRGEKDE